MLQRIRNISNSVGMRIVLLSMVVVFIFWGVGDVIRNTNNHDYITFKHANPVTLTDFLDAKRRFADQLQKTMMDTDGKISDIKEQALNHEVTDMLIQHRLIEYLIHEEEMYISDDSVADYIKSTSTFHDADGNFDANRFSAYMKQSGKSDKEIYNEWRLDIASDIMQNSLMGHPVVPNTLRRAVTAHMAEERMVDLISVNLYDKSASVAYDDKILRKFFDENKSIFQVKDSSNVIYFTVSEDYFAKTAEINEDETLKYFNDNRSEFVEPRDSEQDNQTAKKEDQSAKQFESARDGIKKKLLAKKRVELLHDMLATVENEIASGATIGDLAEKYHFSKQEKRIFKGESSDKLSGVEQAISTNMEKMKENEVSYPIRVDDLSVVQGETFVIFEMLDSVPAGIPDMESIKDRVIDTYKRYKIRQAALSKIQRFYKEASALSEGKDMSSLISEINAKGDLVSLSNHSGYVINRSDVAMGTGALPRGMMYDIFSAKEGGVIAGFEESVLESDIASVSDLDDLMKEDKKVYVAVLRKVGVNKVEADKMFLASKDSMHKYLTGDIFQGILHYLTDKNAPKVNTSIMQ